MSWWDLSLTLNTYPGIRIVLQIDIPEFLSLPWECLYIAELNLPIALVSKHSLVRYFSHPSKILSPVWGTKVRILAVFSSPRGLAPLKLDEEEKVMREVFENRSG